MTRRGPRISAFSRASAPLLDRYPGRMSVGEVGDGARSLKTVADYTSGGDKLHMCYTFDLLGPDFTARHIRNCVSSFEREVKDGWVCWAFSNHDVMRHASRFAATQKSAPMSPGSRSHCCRRCEAPSVSIRAKSLACPRRTWLSKICRTLTASASGRPSRGVTDAAHRCRGSRSGVCRFYEAGKPWLPVPELHRALAVDVQESATRNRCFRIIAGRSPSAAAARS